MPRKTNVESLEVKYCCNGDCYKIKFKAGQLHNNEHPGVCLLVLSSAVKDELENSGVFPEDRKDVRVFRTIPSLLNDCGDIILEWEQIQNGEGASGDCFCFLDSRRQWRCLCEN
jgi:hypothetical protein